MRAGLVLLTGAGISADSGLATFRGAGGLWEGRRVEDVATPEAWLRDPAAVWRFYQLRRAALASVAPNAAHDGLAWLEAELAARAIPCLLVTQNVDDLHERAGSNPVHMHGELAVLRCEGCGKRIRDTGRVDPAAFLACGACGFERLRPDVVWFGELPYHLDRIQRAIEDCSHFAAIGTSGVVYPAAGFLAVARAAGATTIVNGLDAPENLHPADLFLPGRAAEVVPALARQLLEQLGRP